jgi:glutathione synthase/RimK-type ligase-like ATP-grasp enzyme
VVTAARPIALVTDDASLPDDHDMACLLTACAEAGLDAQVERWDDPTVNWADFRAAIFRSPWSYLNRLNEFLAWCDDVNSLTTVLNPIEIVRWTLDKRYLADLAASGVPTVPTAYLEDDFGLEQALGAVISECADGNIIAKPAVGAYSSGVRRFASHDLTGIAEHVRLLTTQGRTALLQPYLSVIEELGETDLIYFDGEFSHAIRKAPLLDASGHAGEPTQDVRSSREPQADELDLADRAMAAVTSRFGLTTPLLYARIDVIRDAAGVPVVHEVELCEPSLSLSFGEGSASRFAQAIRRRFPEAQ